MDTSQRTEGSRERPGGAFRALLVATLVSTFALVTLGGVVRVTDSGLGCPDWPLCHGKIIPPLEFHALIEYSHRLAASLVGGLVVLLALVTWSRYRSSRHVMLPITLALGVLGLEVILGGITVLKELPPTIVTVHLGTAQILFALLLIALARSWRIQDAGASGAPSVFPWAAAAGIGTFLVLLSGSYAVGRGVGTACPDWPLCSDGLFPSSELLWVHMSHRILAGGVGLLVMGAAFVGWRHRHSVPQLGTISVLVALTLVAQILAGAANPWFDFATAARAIHLSLATALWGSLVLLAALTWRPSIGVREVAAMPATSVQHRRPALEVAADYLHLTKPPIILLLLITALGGMFLAAQGLPPASLVWPVMLGGALGAGGASALNHYLDRDIDAAMRRTRQRPVAGGRIEPRRALAFGVVLNILAFGILVTWVNLLSALLTLGATLFYILVYTGWLKRSTPQNIVIGGAAGAVPPLVGWAAVTGGLDLPALYLFAIIFFWTPPHFWALSLLLRSDYARVGIPMLPVVRGVAETAWSIMLHTIILVTITILLFTLDVLGWLYLAGALGLGALFLLFAWRLLRAGGLRGARPLYLYSLLYLMLLFSVVMVDSSLQLG